MAGLPGEDPQVVKALERVAVHDHLCSIFEDQQEQFAVAVPFIRIGLERQEKCVYITAAESMGVVRDALCAGGIDVGSAVESGALTLATKDQTYLQHGSFNPDWMLTFWREAADQACREGFSCLRATGETQWVVRGALGLERWTEYESRLAQTLADSNALALCQYNRGLFPPELILDVIRTHPIVIYRGTVCRNLYFVPPEELLAEGQTEREVQRLLSSVRDRERLDEELRRAHAELEQRVLDRTRQLREQEEWLRLAQKAAGLGIADWDVRSGQARYTEEFFRIYGLEPAERTLSYEQWIASLHPNDRATIREGIAAAFEAQRPWEGEFRVVLPDGSVRWIAAKATILFDEEGKPTRLIATNMDITARKRAEEAQLSAQKLTSIGLLAGGVAHDFNNILTGIMGNACLVLEDAPRRLQDRIERIIEGAEKAGDLTRQLLAYAGKSRFVIEELNLSDVVRETVGLLRLTVPKTVELRCDLAGGLPVVTADAGQIQQIVMNLVANAAEAIGHGEPGTVSITTGTDDPRLDRFVGPGQIPETGEYVYLQVSDTGCGMDDMTRSAIFDPFFSTKFLGRGLGLAAVSGIVRSHGGYVSVTTAPGVGSTFRVYLPATAPSRATPGSSAAHTSVARGGKLLVVDDEECVRQFVGETLRREGYEVLLANDGREALSVFEEQRRQIDLVLLDLILPSVNGAQVLQQMRRLEPSVKVLLTSGYGAFEAERLCGTENAWTFLQKPFTAERLAHAVRRAMQ